MSAIDRFIKTCAVLGIWCFTILIYGAAALNRTDWVHRDPIGGIVRLCIVGLFFLYSLALCDELMTQQQSEGGA